MAEAMVEFVIAQSTSPDAGSLAGLLPIVAFFLILYFVFFRPMRKSQKARETMVESLKNGDKVITSGGIYGTVSGLRDHTILLKVSDKTKIEVAKSAISAKQSPPENTA